MIPIRTATRRLLVITLLIATTPLSRSQSPGAAGSGNPDKVWSGSFGGGLSLTTGNTETLNYNLTFNSLRDAKGRNRMKFTGLYLRGQQDGEANIDRLTLGFRDDFTLSDNTFFFGGIRYARDRFKEIDYLVNPVGGLGYKLADSEELKLELGAGAGVFWEQDTNQLLDRGGSLNAGQELTWVISPSARLEQSVSGLWKMEDLADALYSFQIGLVTSITSHVELKVEFRDDYQARPPSPATLSNDTATLVSFVFKF